jgi:rod shape-determining protein MreD
MANKIISAEYIFSALFVLFFQIIIASRISIGGVTADMAIIITVWFAFVKTPRIALIYGFVLGFLAGMISPIDMGWAAMLLALTGFMLANLKEKIVMEALPIRITTLFVIAFFYQLVFLGLSRFDMIASDPSFLLLNSLFSTIYTTIIGTMIYLFIEYRYILRNMF